MEWGYALVWMPQYMTRDADPMMARLRFLVDHGLKATGTSADELLAMDEAKRDQVGQFIHDHGLALTLRPHVEYLAPDVEAVKRQAEAEVARIAQVKDLVRAPIVATGVATAHRFMRSPSLAEQMDRLAAVLPILVEGCAALGLPFSIENHGDYYVSDLVSLIERVPGLKIYLDTGNTYLVGEAPLPAFHAAAPYVVGGHFKDHRVRPMPDARPLHFEVGPSIIGEGDVPLRECFDILKANTPNFDNLILEIELIPPSDVPPLETLARSLAFVRSLSGHTRDAHGGAA